VVCPVCATGAGSFLAKAGGTNTLTHAAITVVINKAPNFGMVFCTVPLD